MSNFEGITVCAFAILYLSMDDPYLSVMVLKSLLVMQLAEGIEGAALAGAVDALLITQQNAERAGIAAPGQGWGPWAASLSAAAQGQLDPAPADGSIGALSACSMPQFMTIFSHHTCSAPSLDRHSMVIKPTMFCLLFVIVGPFRNTGRVHGTKFAAFHLQAS